ncbi:MAG TPA: hypothetical protein VGB77_11775, partial [Abditibacteriaceae bacterium]|jgi:hypothetical protein
MSRIILSLKIKTTFVKDELLIRLIEIQDGHHLSCWSLPANRCLFGLDDPLEEDEFQNWKISVDPVEVREWLQILEFQKISINPTLADFESRDGTSYQFQFFAEKGASIVLRWHNELPDNWAALDFIVDRLQELAKQ